MLSCYQFMKQKPIFITKKTIYTGKLFLRRRQKLSKMLYYNRPILRSVFADVLMFKHELP